MTFQWDIGIVRSMPLSRQSRMCCMNSSWSRLLIGRWIQADEHGELIVSAARHKRRGFPLAP